jgi:hypothetical protein
LHLIRPNQFAGSDRWICESRNDTRCAFRFQLRLGKVDVGDLATPRFYF